MQTNSSTAGCTRMTGACTSSIASKPSAFRDSIQTWPPLFAILLVSVFFAKPVLGEEEAEFEPDDCIGCHTKKEPHIDVKLLNESVHGDLDCEECHPQAMKYPHPKPLKTVQCAVCHAEANKAFATGVHAHLAITDAQDLPTCRDCHGTHNIFKKTDVRATINHFQIDATCIKCHASTEITGRHAKMPDAAKVKAFLTSAHGKGMHAKGLSVSATCTDCHGHHAILPKEDPHSPVNPANVPLTCKKCHIGVFHDFEKSAHGKFWKEHLIEKNGTELKEGGQKGPVCSTCHKSHEAQVTESFQATMVAQCGTCHAEKILTYHDTFHGKASDLGFVLAAKCADCHTPHHNLPEDDPQSTIHPKNLADTCGQCHPGANASFIEFRPHLNANNKEQSKLVYYVHFFMKWLLTAVFSFFGIHTLLWLQRSLVGYFRGEFPRHKQEGPYIQRFKKQAIVLHILMIVTFLGLVSTGLPLKYHFTQWAQDLSFVLGGIAAMRFLHRLCGLIMLSFFLWHLGSLARTLLLKRRFDLLKGPLSMVPRPKDLIDFLHNLRWFLYLGARPQYDRWTYFEKFDYFAVFWGVPILGLSGLLMWFPGFFSQYVSGIAFNLATVIHSEEALLAAAFIFIFHFYHNHFRVENFPMDTSIFTGKMTLERFKDERPEEYRRMKEEGRLEEIMTEAPDADTLRKSKVFGFIALAIGSLLVFAILFTYFSGH